MHVWFPSVFNTTSKPAMKFPLMAGAMAFVLSACTSTQAEPAHIAYGKIISISEHGTLGLLCLLYLGLPQEVYRL